MDVHSAHAAAIGCKTLWLGDLPSFADEAYLAGLFAAEGVASVKLIRNRVSGMPEGYAFLEFSSHEGAADVLARYNGQPIPFTECLFRLNWAAHGVGRTTPEADHSIFVGDLAPDVTDLVLQETFRSVFPSVRSAKVIADPATGRSRGYGFVRFGDGGERDAALARMQGHILSDRAIRVSVATAKKGSDPTALGMPPRAGSAGPGGPPMGGGGMMNGMGGMLGGGGLAPPPDPTLTTVFVGNLADAGDAELRGAFGHLGAIEHTKVPPGKGCGFVQFADRAAAEAAVATMQGARVGTAPVRVSWGRGPCGPRAGGAAAGAYGGYGAGPAPFDGGAGGYGGAAAPAAAPAAAQAGLWGPPAPAAAGFAPPALAGAFAGGAGAGANGGGGVAVAAPSHAGAVVGGAGAAPTSDPLGPVDVDSLNAAYLRATAPTLALGTHIA